MRCPKNRGALRCRPFYSRSSSCGEARPLWTPSLLPLPARAPRSKHSQRLPWQPELHQAEQLHLSPHRSAWWGDTRDAL